MNEVRKIDGRWHVRPGPGHPWRLVTWKPNPNLNRSIPDSPADRGELAFQRPQQRSRAKPRPDRPCEHCGKVMEAPRATRLYCNAECRAKAAYARTSAATPPRPAQPPRPCEHCGEPMYDADIRRLFCSDSCRHAEHRNRHIA